jgi:hypothetical protein
VLQARNDDPAKPTKPIQWQFTVEGTEKIQDTDCTKVKVQCQLPGKQPQTTIWLDGKTAVLRKLETQLAVHGEYRTITETYQHSAEQPSPVFVPVTAIPLDIPVFLDNETKAIQFSYVVQHPQPAEVKSLDAVTFQMSARQIVRAVTPVESKSLVPETFTKDLTKKATVAIELVQGKRTILQVWQADQPWPIYSNNGRTQSKLVSVTRAN